MSTMMMKAVLCGDAYSCLSSMTGLEAIKDWDWSTFSPSPSQNKHVRFHYPLVTSCHYRPRETREERSQLYFTEREMMKMRAQAKEVYETGKLNDSLIVKRSRSRKPFTPKFEMIAQTGSDVKVMYAVPKNKTSSTARGIRSPT